jgi:hypothetical protein
MNRINKIFIDAAVGFYVAAWQLFIGVGKYGNVIVDSIMEAIRRLPYLLNDLGKSDGDTKPSVYNAANTSLSHIAIGLWTALGASTLGAPVWVAVLIGFTPWGVVWEGIQYHRMPTVRVLRDTMLGDNPSYLAGALAMSLVWEYGFIAWLSMTPILIIVAGIVGISFGRVPPK